MGPRARSAPTFLLLLLAGCASSSAHLPRVVTIEEGRRVRVTLSDAQGRMFAMQNLSSGSRNEVYRDPGATVQPKVVRDTDLQTLLDALADRGMFTRATPAAPSEARAVIAVQTSDRSWFWARPAVDPLRDASQQPGLREFDEARGYVLAVYNSEMSFHAGTIDSFAPEVRKQIDDARKAPGAPATRNDK